MNDQPLDPRVAALAALRRWATLAAHGTALEEASAPLRDHLRRTAWLVAGAEPRADWPQPLAGPLEAIFSRVRRDGETPVRSYLRPASLRLSREVLFPSDRPAAGSRELVAGALRDDLAALDRRNLPPEAQLEGTLFALQRHTWALPSPLDAVSLYDFARTHAALAAALAGDPDGEVCLVGGDLSGVQSFLYTLTADGATKQLRGRSLYLQLLTDACARSLLLAAGMPASNLLYAGGGRFYLLLPTTIDGLAMEDWLKGQRRRLDTFFLRAHQAELYLALGAGRVSQADLVTTSTAEPESHPSAFQTAWGRATEAINEAKRRRFADLGAAFAEVFAPEGHSGNQDHSCVVCGFQGDPENFRPRQEGEPSRCRLCDSFEDLGRLLHNASHLIVHHLVPPGRPTQPARGRRAWQERLADLGLHVQLSGEHARPGERGNAPPSQAVRFTSILDLNDEALDRPDTELLRELHLTGLWVRGLRPIANTTPTMREQDLRDWKPDQPGERAPQPGEVKPFSVMVAQGRGIKRLAVLRMDVDDLGDIFQYQLSAGLAGVAALSAALSRFFEGWVGVLCDTMNQPERRGERGGPGLDGRGSVYCIYSGGDDLFIVGSWHLLPVLAGWICDDLAAYTGHHPGVHASAGISLHTAKFPLYQAAEAAEEELQRAKARKGKAAMGMLNQVVGWEHMPRLTQLVRDLDAYLGHDKPSALLQTLQQLYVQYEDELDPERRGRRRRRAGQAAYGPWMWRGAYQLRRVEQGLRGDENKSYQKLIQQLRDELDDLKNLEAPANEGARNIERHGLAARWAQLLHRKEHE